MKIRSVSIKDYKKIKILFKKHNMNLISFERWAGLWKKNPSSKNNQTINFPSTGYLGQTEKNISYYFCG